MRVEVRIDGDFTEPLVVITTAGMTDEVNALLARINAPEPRALAGFRDGLVELLAPEDVLRVYAATGRVYAVTLCGEFALRQRIYELEQQLARHGFVRISNSELVNLKQVKSLDLSMAGTICARMADGSVAYASRRYVARIKDALGI